MEKREGKTKIITPLLEGGSVGVVMTKDDITAGDGAKHDVMIGKAELATRTTCNMFEYLRAKGIPVAYIGRDGPTTFLARICDMILVEVVVRRIATGSYLKRYPHVFGGTIFEDPVIEFFYKTTGRRIGDQRLPCDDPWMIWNNDQFRYDLYLPNMPPADGYIGPLELPDVEIDSLADQLKECSVLAADINTHLRDAWSLLDGTLYDVKLEFGVSPDGSIVLADVVDCDNWRVVWKGTQLSKQPYREGACLDKMLGIYRLAASLTDRLV